MSSPIYMLLRKHGRDEIEHVRSAIYLSFNQNGPDGFQEIMTELFAAEGTDACEIMFWLMAIGYQTVSNTPEYRN